MNIKKTLFILATAVTVSVVATAPASAGALGTYTSDAKGFDTHTYWYDDGRELTIIDTQFVPAHTSHGRSNS